MPQVSLTELVTAVCSGKSLISFPTDTVPALAARPAAAALIYAAKQRSQTKPLILMAAAAADLWDYVSGSSAEQTIWQQTAASYFPGAVTLVLPASEQLPTAMNPTDPTTIGVRVPNHPIARQILALTGPLATTSVNRSGQPPLLTMAEIHEQFPEVVTLHPDELNALAEDCHQQYAASGMPSTVAKWTGKNWEILRQGAVKLELS